MNSKRRKAILISMAVTLAVGFQTMPMLDHFGISSQVHGTTMWINSKLVGTASAVQGDQNVVINIEVENKENGDFTFDSATLNIDPSKEITITGGSTGTITLTKNQKANVSFYLNIDRYATTGIRYLKLTLRRNGVVVHENYSIERFTIYEKLATPSNGAGTYVAALDITHAIKPTSGFILDGENVLTLEVYNNGNTVIKNAEMSLSLPEGLAVYNASNTANLGYISTGTKREVSFPIAVEGNIAGKNYPISVELTGLNFTNSDVSLKKTFYIPVVGDGASTTVKNIEITNISIPNQVSGQEDFNLSFRVENKNSINIKNFKVYADIPEGILNKTRSTFIEANIPAGSSKDYTITLFAEDSSKEKTYPIKIVVEPVSGDTSSGNAAIQYTSVYIKGVAGSSKTPQLMVDRYSYGGTFVQAGDEFLLNLGLYNTSGSHNLTNIKVTLSSDDGTFIPVNSSNAFFIDQIGIKGHYTKSISLSVKPSAKQETTALNVDMSYEDGAGNAFTSKDVISIPIMQETRLVVDDVIAPPELYAMMQSGVSVQFYNMGKTVLNNLRVTAEGDFDTPESTSYFVGNMESGKSDYYDFSFIPRQGGAMEGKIVFTYEDASGDEQRMEKLFTFDVMAEMPVFNPGMPPMEDKSGSGSKWPWILVGILILLGGGCVFGWRRFKKKKINQEMEIDE